MISTAVILTADDAEYLSRALSELSQVVGPHRIPKRLDAMIDNLMQNARKTQGNARPNARNQRPQHVSGNHGGYGTVTTREAAQILGCTMANARDLANRGSIPGGKTGGRWWLDATAVVRRAELRR